MQAIIPFILLSTLLYSKSFANDEKNTVTANLNMVTVFRSGAEMIHNAKASFVKRNNELLIEEIRIYGDI